MSMNNPDQRRDHHTLRVHTPASGRADKSTGTNPTMPATDEAIQTLEGNLEPTLVVFATPQTIKELIARIRQADKHITELTAALHIARERLRYDSDLFIDQGNGMRAHATLMALDECDIALAGAS